MVAAQNRHEVVVQQLLGWENVNSTVVQLLLERDNVDADIAVSFAAYNGHEAIVRLLLEQGDC